MNWTILIDFSLALCGVLIIILGGTKLIYLHKENHEKMIEKEKNSIRKNYMIKKQKVLCFGYDDKPSSVELEVQGYCDNGWAITNNSSTESFTIFVMEKIEAANEN